MVSTSTELKSGRLGVVLGVTDPRHEAARDLAQTAALRRILDLFADRGLPVLLMKGTALSHSVYTREVRPRNDEDLLIRPAEFDRAAALLVEAGYTRVSQVTHVAVTGQQLFCRRVFGLTHYVDLHARPLNPFAFAELPTFDEFWAASVALPALGRGAFRLGPVHALLLACAHRVAHHTPTEDPVWLLDIDRLARALGDGEWPEFVATATRSRCARLCATELRRAQMTHGTSVPAFVLVDLERAGAEPTARHLRPLGPLHVQWLNFRHARSWTERVTLVKAHLFPPADYMRERFAVQPGDALAWAYARRWLRGGSRWIREFVYRLQR